MGMFRYFLALCVVLAHTPYVDAMAKPFDGNGGIPVQIFFLISGFYMSLIFEKYQLQKFTFAHLKNFYVTRSLRIYPVYFVCLIAMFLFLSNNITPPEPFRIPTEAMSVIHTLGSKIFYIAENILIFGQSLMRFFIFDADTGSFLLHPMTSPTTPGPIGCGFTMMGQAWTLSLELTFYLLVPFILQRGTLAVILLCVASFLLRITLHYLGYDNYNFQNAFFPTALGIFLLGSISHRVIYPFVRDFPTSLVKKAGWVCLAFILYYAMHLYHAIPSIEVRTWGFAIFITLTLPILFCSFKDSKIDRNIGELSYPIYMAQYLAIALALKFFDLHYIGYVDIAISNMIAFALLFLIVKPVDLFRHANFVKSRQQATLKKPELKEPFSVATASS
jgi:peptidoglycan/LPS O-acetylase OafA/YrhL